MGEVIGIDLGTTYSVVAHITEDGRPEVIPDELGHAITPSVVDCATNPPTVGVEAKERQSAGDADVAAFFKRNMGDPAFVLALHGRDYSPTELSALVLKHLKDQAERHLAATVTKAVITVPAYFTHLQRQATIEAGERVGIQVLKLISEPTAAALAYGLRPGAQRGQRVLVYDLGGGTFDVSLVEITPDEVRVIATDGDHHLGGRDWDDRILIHLQDRFETQFGVDLVGNDFGQLLIQAEQLKHALSARQAAEVTLRAAGHTARYTITRAEFEDLTRDLVARTEVLTDWVLTEARLAWDQIDGVVPVGGSTRMPMIRACIERISGTPPMGGVNPDEAVALGAAIQAAIEMERVSGDQAPIYRLSGRKNVRDVIAHSLGIIVESADASCYINRKLIERNSQIPADSTRPFRHRLRHDGMDRLDVFLTQSESEDPQDCDYLGCYAFTDFPAGAPNEATLDITYAYDRSGIVNVKATEQSTGHPLTLTVHPVPSDVPARFAIPPGSRAVREPMTVYLAFDLSVSMRGEPLAEAKRAATDLVQRCDLAAIAIGLMSFSDTVLVDQPATQQNHQIMRAIEDLAIGRTGRGNLAQPFDDVYQRLVGVPGHRYAIVLADGVWVNQRHAARQAKRCHAEGINIIAVGFGKADRRFLAEIASSSEQSFFTDLSHLTETFGTIARDLSDVAAGRGRMSSGLHWLS